jgi:integrase
LLHDATIRSYTRIAGLFMLLFAQPLSRIRRMRPDQIALLPDTVTITFAIEMPEPLDQLLREHLDRGGPASYANTGTWLFPGRLPGKHLVTENIRSELVAHGIRPHYARHAAMFHLAADLPTPVLAELLGISPTTASRWAAPSARTWAQYTAMRRGDRPDRAPADHDCQSRKPL